MQEAQAARQTGQFEALPQAFVERFRQIAIGQRPPDQFLQGRIDQPGGGRI